MYSNSNNIHLYYILTSASPVFAPASVVRFAAVVVAWLMLTDTGAGVLAVVLLLSSSSSVVVWIDVAAVSDVVAGVDVAAVVD